MKARRIGVGIAVFGAVYLAVVAWMSSWWYVPALLEHGPRTFAEGTLYGGRAFSVMWASSGVIGAIAIGFGAAVYSAVGSLRLLLLAAGGTLLAAWLGFWSTVSHHPVVFGIAGGLILLCFLMFYLDWSAIRRDLEPSTRSASDLRLAANVSFFIAAWGLCGLLGGPTFALRPESSQLRQNSSAGPSLAIKVLVCLVLGWVFTAVAQRMERCATKQTDRTRLW